ncbi:MAG: 1-acyl-sn-glycerol-3-phosphate acyltransferase [Myxococcales bacterium]|nr:1-acyl-sn-glycerol-3-phosphate acyltransferase [Myxococcales bacterium]
MSALDGARGDYLRATRSLRFAIFSAQLLASYEAARLRTKAERHDALRAEYKSRMGRGTLDVLGARLSWDGKIPRDTKAKLIVANHRSGLDIAVMLALFDAMLLSRADVANWPVLGRLATHGGTLYVDRADKNSGARAIRTIRRALAGGASVCVFPEGTTAGGREVRPFHAGAFVAARGLDVEVLPVGFGYEHGSEWTEPTFTAHLANVAAREGAKIHACIGTPFALDMRADEAAARARSEVAVLASRARARLGAGQS